MTIEKEYSTKLSVDGVTIDRRDIEMLDAIDRTGSMHKAADDLGRSYARLQNRVVELEEAVGSITERRRGGSGGGGTELTQTARQLCRQFDRHEAELNGVARVTESVFAGSVRDRTGELATVETDIGPILALVPHDANDVQVSVRSDAVVLTDPETAPRADGTSLRNQFTGTVADVESSDAITRVTVRLEADGNEDKRESESKRENESHSNGETETIQALITNASTDRLALEADQPITVSFKATAARAVSIDPDSLE